MMKQAAAQVAMSLFHSLVAATIKSYDLVHWVATVWAGYYADCWGAMREKWYVTAPQQSWNLHIPAQH